MRNERNEKREMRNEKWEMREMRETRNDNSEQGERPVHGGNHKLQKRIPPLYMSFSCSTLVPPSYHPLTTLFICFPCSTPPTSINRHVKWMNNGLSLLFFHAAFNRSYSAWHDMTLMDDNGRYSISCLTWAWCMILCYTGWQSMISDPTPNLTNLTSLDDAWPYSTWCLTWAWWMMLSMSRWCLTRPRKVISCYTGWHWIIPPYP